MTLSYLERAAVELLLLSMLAAIVGPLIVMRGRAFYSVALSHATFPGGVIAAMLGINVLFGQAVAALLLTVLLALLSRVKRQGAGTATGIVLVFGFALGSLLASLQGGSSIPVESLLIGSLFGVQTTDIVVAAVVLGSVVAVLGFTHRALFYDTFDRIGFRAAGGNPLLPELVATAITAATIVVAMPAVGAILAVSLVVGPAATAQLLVRNIAWVPPVAFILAVTASAVGLWLSWHFAVAAGGAIGLVVALLFLLSLGVRAIRT
ncbi:metal ABC transporter permease [Canibacter zhoujuaniae]|uniref:metal ABC transporter permease n=1 Tax=Canibacter zhoujuaniae TaxID=2708343 RepID=UPI0014240C84|nr:metal ABC transporter permease [Canibacter zhoujuaniae]